MRTFTTLLSGLSLLFASMAFASDDIQEGVDYYLIDPPQPTENPGQIEVIEVFAYTCPACYAFKPHMAEYEENMPEYVDYKRLAAPFGGLAELMARVFFTLETMGQGEQLHDELFEALHVKRERWRSIDDVADYLADHGVDPEKFKRTARSFPVESSLRRAMQQIQRSGVNGTPNVIVNGKYRVAARSGAGFGHMADVIAHLVEREHAAMQDGEGDQSAQAND